MKVAQTIQAAFKAAKRTDRYYLQIINSLAALLLLVVERQSFFLFLLLAGYQFVIPSNHHQYGFNAS